MNVIEDIVNKRGFAAVITGIGFLVITNLPPTNGSIVLDAICGLVILCGVGLIIAEGGFKC